MSSTHSMATVGSSTLTTLQQELQRLEGSPIQVTADSNFNVSGSLPKEHAYSVSITDAGFDTAAFAQSKVSATRNGAVAMSPAALGQNDRRSALIRSAPDDDDVVDVQVPKRARTDGPVGNADDGNAMKQVNELSTFMRSWHDEWTRQGGWLFDTLNATNKLSTESKASIDKKLDSVQDILGQSINAASATTMGELATITKLLPWLEYCRKASADKVLNKGLIIPSKDDLFLPEGEVRQVLYEYKGYQFLDKGQAREEKWRSSSATFHDQTRREREAAERRLEEKLEAQQRLLIKIAEANGVDVDDLSDKPRSREESLGAQLTAELNLEAARAAGNGTLTKYNNTINIDD